MEGFLRPTRRPYRMLERRTIADRTGARILAAARALLSAPGGVGAFTVDAVARAARVTRMTVYHHFGSKTGLVEAMFDSLAIVRLGIPRLVAALDLPDPYATLDAFIATFADVWQRDRVLIRRLQGLAAVDPEFGAVWRDRHERRRVGLRLVVARARRGKRPSRRQQDQLTDLLYALIAFETFDVIAGPKRRLRTVVPLVRRLARDALATSAIPPARSWPDPRAPRATRAPRRRSPRPPRAGR
ncbi:MAG TPA: TetR/AcrR family transcriptional regulator [Gemmatimonadales bacterium]